MELWYRTNNYVCYHKNKSMIKLMVYGIYPVTRYTNISVETLIHLFKIFYSICLFFQVYPIILSEGYPFQLHIFSEMYMILFLNLAVKCHGLRHPLLPKISVFVKNWPPAKLTSQSNFWPLQLAVKKKYIVLLVPEWNFFKNLYYSILLASLKT